MCYLLILRILQKNYLFVVFIAINTTRTVVNSLKPMRLTGYKDMADETGKVSFASSFLLN